MSRQLLVADAEHRIARMEHYATNIAFAIRAEWQARQDRDALLDRMTNQLIGQPNPLTEKPHSATSAEKAVKDTDAYREAAMNVLNAEAGRVLAISDYDRALLTARLMVAVVEGHGVESITITTDGKPTVVDYLKQG